MPQDSEPQDISARMQQLYGRYGDLPGISIELHKELLALRVENRQATATIFLQGAQLAHYQKTAEQPTIWCSPLCDYREGTPLRGGIPICWPWFGDLARNPDSIQQHHTLTDAPAHGLVRDREWQVDSISFEGEEVTHITLTLKLPAIEGCYGPYPSDLRLTLSVGEKLTALLEIENRGDKAFVFSCALHSYFAVGDIDKVSVNGLEQLQYIDCMDDWQQRTQEGAATIDQEVDRIYLGTHNTINLVDKSWQRVISVHSEGSDSTVLWNPWQDKASRLSHFADDAYREMLCIETANVGSDCVTLPPGASHSLRMTISSNTLD